MKNANLNTVLGWIYFFVTFTADYYGDFTIQLKLKNNLGTYSDLLFVYFWTVFEVY